MFVWVLGFIDLGKFQHFAAADINHFLCGAQEYESNDYISKLRGSLHPSQPSENLSQEMICSKKATSSNNLT